MESGISAAVLDLRWLSPLDEAAIGLAVANSGGRVLVVHEAVMTGGFGAEIAARIHENWGGMLQRRSGGLPRPTSASRPRPSCRRRSFPMLTQSRSPSAPCWCHYLSPLEAMIDLAGKVLLLTGAAGGIGSAIATTFHRLGARMLLGDFDEAGVAALALSLDPSGSKVVPLGYDASSPADADAAVAACVAHFGRVDYVVLAAAIYEDQRFSTITDEQWRRTMAVNLDGVFYVCRRSLPYMQKGSAIVTIASDAAHEGSSVGHVHYGTSKGGVLTLTRSLARELAPDIRVNTVSPGTIDTPMVREFMKRNGGEFLAITPAGRIGRAEEVANTVAFLCSDASSYIPDKPFM